VGLFMKNNYKFGFTLAEMMVMLLLVSSVFVLTIPVLKQSNTIITPQYNPNIKQVSFSTLLSRAFLDINQGLSGLMSDFNCNDLKCTGIFSKNGSNQILGDSLVKNMNVLKNCKTTKNSGCFSPKYDSMAGVYRFITAAGASVLTNNNNDDCSGELNGIVICGEIYVDVNGLQLPNSLGKDIFYLYITDKNAFFPQQDKNSTP